jgi:hypothetical protein
MAFIQDEDIHIYQNQINYNLYLQHIMSVNHTYFHIQ